jgi:type VI secretion system secreted protein Hcp
MAALRSNEVIIKAVLTLRKSGAGPLEFLKITIEQGRVTGLTIEAGDKSGSPDLFEELTFTFNKISVEYTPQGKEGLGKGSMMFEDQWESNS